MRKQINKSQNGLTNEKQRGDALARITALEAHVEVLRAQMKRSFEALNQQIDAVAQVLDAASELLGVETVVAKVREKKMAQLEAEAQNTARAVEEEVARGTLVPVETVEADDFLVVTQQADKDGVVGTPSLLHGPVQGYNEAVKAWLPGKKVSDRLLLDNGGTLTILAVYKPSVPPAATPGPEAEPMAVEGGSTTAGA